MEDYLENLGTTIVLHFDGTGQLKGAAAESVFGIKGVPAEIAATLPARKGAVSFKAPAALKTFFTQARLDTIIAQTKAHAAAAWQAETAANKPTETLDLEA